VLEVMLACEALVHHRHAQWEVPASHQPWQLPRRHLTHRHLAAITAANTPADDTNRAMVTLMA
jgi:hypothetical protein